jgi:hypothetical protein
MSESVINLVFDNFDQDGNPIPNGSHITELKATLSNEFLNKNSLRNFNFNIKTKLYHLNDITNDDIFYYIVGYTTSHLKKILDDTFILSNKAIEFCKNKNLKILFVNFHEVNHDEFYILKQIVKYISYLGLEEDNFYYINNNSKLEEYRNILNSKIHTYKSMVVFEFIASILSETKTFFKPNKEFLFLCHNRIFKKHRIETLSFLKKHNILENTDWSNLNKQYKEVVSKEYVIGTRRGETMDIQEDKSISSKIGLKYSKYEIDKIDLLELGQPEFGIAVTPECYLNCYINIITETFFYIPEIHISEKSFRPFYFMQLPIFVATHNHVKYLRKQFGFDMFDDFIDHSYDLENDHINRMKMVLEEVKRLNDNKDLVIEFYKQNKHRFEKNLELFQTACNKKETLNFFKNINTFNKINNTNDYFDKNQKKSLV